MTAWPPSRLAIDEFEPEGVLDLSDEPVLGYRERMELAGVTLARGLPYLGGDFRLGPADRGSAAPGTHDGGDRHGEANREDGHLGSSRAPGRSSGPRSRDRRDGPRGAGPSRRWRRPESVDLARLLELVRSGEHAASDYLEDALTTGVTTIGARRAGGGLAGAPYATNVREAAELGVERGAGVVVLEGSGSAVPPVPWDGGCLVAPASVPVEYLTGYLDRSGSCCRTCWLLLWLPTHLLGTNTSPRSAPTSAASWMIRGRVRHRFHPGSIGRCEGRASVLHHDGAFPGGRGSRSPRSHPWMHGRGVERQVGRFGPASRRTLGARSDSTFSSRN